MKVRNNVNVRNKGMGQPRTNNGTEVIRLLVEAPAAFENWTWQRGARAATQPGFSQVPPQV